MTSTLEPPTAPARWLHYWAVLTAVATVPLLFLGAEVTTNKVGMVDAAWPTPPWYLLLMSWVEHGIGFLIEHSHRLAAWTVGFSSVGVVVGLWGTERDRRRWLCWLGTAAMLGVGIQGLLGGLRVRLDALYGPNLAVVHGCFGQLVFALLTALALCTSRRWSAPVEASAPEETAALRHTAFLVVALVFVQLVLGAIYRHRGFTGAVRGHFMVAFAVVAAVVWLVKTAVSDRPADGGLKGMVRLLAVLVGLQVMFGVEAFFVKQAMPEWDGSQHWLWRRDLVRSAHVLIGSLILATSVVISLEAQRRTAWAASASPTAEGRLEGAA